MHSEERKGAKKEKVPGTVFVTEDGTVTYDCAGNSGLDDIISRLSALTDSPG